MNWHAEIKKLRREMEDKLANALGQLFLWTLTANSSALGSDQIENGDQPSDDGNGQKRVGQRPAKRIEPFGYRGVPPAKLRQFSVRLGSSNVVTLGIGVTNTYGPDDLKDGESCQYCKADGARFFLDENGGAKVDASSGQKVLLQGGGKGVARLDDTTAANTTMAAWVSAVTAKFNAPAAPMASAPGTLTPPTDFGKINSASTKTETG